MHEIGVHDAAAQGQRPGVRLAADAGQPVRYGMALLPTPDIELSTPATDTAVTAK